MKTIKKLGYFLSLYLLMLLTALPSKAINVQIGTGTETGESPISGNWGGGKSQFIFTSNEISSNGGIAGFVNSLSFKLTENEATSNTLTSFSVKLQNTTLNAFSSFVSSGWTTSYDEAFTLPTTPGWISIPLTTPFMWDGTSNLLVEVCWAIGTTTRGGSSLFEYTTTANELFRTQPEDNRTSCGDIIGEGDNSNNRPNVLFEFIPVTLPYLTSTPTNWAYGYVGIDSISSIKTFLINGDNLNPAEGDLTITLPGTPAFQVSIDGGETWLTDQGFIPYVGNPIATPIPLKIRFVPTAELNYKDSVIINGGSATSKIKLSGSSILQYCNPGNYELGADIAKVTVGSFTYTSQAINPVLSNVESNQSYNDYRDSVAAIVVKAGTTVPYSLNIINDNDWPSINYVKVYVDLNKDAILDPVAELIDSLYIPTPWLSDGVVNGIMDIPANAIVGQNTLIRFVLTTYENSTSCYIGNFDSREVEDYWVNFTTPDPYVLSTPKSLDMGFVAPATISSSGIFYITAGLLTSAPGNLTATVTDNFQISLNGTDWSNTVTIPYSSSSLTSTPLYVHCISPAIPIDIQGTITFNGGGVSNHIVNLSASGNIQYCNTGFASGNAIDIANISVSNLQNYGISSMPAISNPLATATYTNNFNLAPICQLRAGVPYQFTANIISSYEYAPNAKLNVYIDYNGNGEFTDENELVLSRLFNSPDDITAPLTLSGEFLVPGDLIPTNVNGAFPRMRIVLTTNSAVGPCTVETSQYHYGEVEDYKIQILPALPMTYASTTTAQVGKKILCAGYHNQRMLRVNVNTNNAADPLSVNQIVFNTNGTFPTSAITNAKLFYTGASSTFDTTTQVGSTVTNPNGEISFVFATQQILLPSNNYYWLTYSVALDASLESVLDAELTGLYISDEPEVNKVLTPQAPEGFSLVNRMKFDGSFPIATTEFPIEDWTSIATLGLAIWRTAEIGNYPTNAPHSAPALAEFNSRNCDEGNASALISPVFAMNGESEPTTMSLYLYRSDNPDNGSGSIFKVFMNTMPTLTGATALNLQGSDSINAINVLYNQGSVTESDSGWYKYTYQIPAGFNTSTNYLLFEGTSDSYNNIHLDDVTIGEDAFMHYAGLDTLRTGMNSFATSSTNNLVSEFNVRTVATNSPFAVSNVKLTAEGTTSLADVANAVVWYLGDTLSFNPETNVLFGTFETITNGEMTIVPIDGADPVLLSEGNNYFAITFDVTANATPGNFVDCKLNSITYARGEISNTIVVPNGNTWGTHEIKLPMNGTYTIGGTPLATRWYPTLTVAANDINLLGIGADVNFAIAGDLTIDPNDPPVFLPINGTDLYTLRIYPTTNVTITGSYSGNAGMIMLCATDRIVIDGRINQTGERGLTVINTKAGCELFMTTSVSSGSIDNAAIQYVNFIGNNKNNNSTLLQINGGFHTNININHCNFKKSSEGIVVTATDLANKVQNLTVDHNTFGDELIDEYSIGFTALDLNYIDNMVFTHNTIANIINSTDKVFGLMVNNDVTNSIFSFNKMNKIINSGTNRAGGFYVNSTNNSNIIFANNSIRGINSNATGDMIYAPSAFFFDGGGNYKLYNNSVRLEGNRSTINTTVPSTPSAVVYVATSVTALDLRNNLFVNELVSSVPTLKNYGIYCESPASAFTMLNNNNYYITGNAPFIGHLTVDTVSDRATIEEWRTATNRDVNSFSNKVTFETSSAMHLSGASACNVNLDVPVIETVAYDVDGLMRSATTKMGVDEVFAELTINSQAPVGISNCIVTGQDNLVSIPSASLSVASYSDGIVRTFNPSDLQINWTKNGEPFAGTGVPLQVLYTAIPEVTDIYQAQIVAPDILLDATIVSLTEGPAVFTLSGTGTLCSNSTTGVDLTLSGSQIGVNYELMLGSDLATAPIAGTGSPITFTNITSIGDYEVYAYNATISSCSSKMTGTATITAAPVATAFNVTGGGVICIGSTDTKSVGVEASQGGVVYSLLLNGNATAVTPVNGTGGAISFGTFTTPGTYTVKALRGTCETIMTGSATITSAPAPTAFAVTGGGVGTSAIGLESSEADVTYTLLKDNVVITPTVSVVGTGSTITFGTFTEAGTYTVKAAHGTCESDMIGSAIVTAAPTGYTLSGTLKYANNANTAMNNCAIIVKSGTTEIGRATTDATGNYSVTGLPNGTYTITVQTTKTPGGINSLDILPLKQKLANSITLTPLRTKAADINNNGLLNSLDILPLKQKLANQSAPNFLVPNFVFYPTTFTITDANATLNIQSLCGGDVNASFTPANN